MSGLWRIGGDSPLRQQNASGVGTLLVRSGQDVLEAIRFLRAAVEETRGFPERKVA